MNSMSSQSNGNDAVKKAAAFLAGFTSSQLFILIVSSGSYAVDRFMLPRSYVGLYINRTIIAFRLSTFFGSLLLNILVPSTKNFARSLPIISTISSWLYFLSFLALLLIYYNGGKKGHIMYYYCAIIFSSMVFGSNNVCLLGVIGKDVAYYIGSMQLSAIMVSAYQFLFTKIAKAWMVTNIPYKLIVGQLSLAVFVSGISAILWSVAYASEKIEAKETNFNGLGKALSPIMLTTLGFGMQNFFYPAIAPYKLTDVSTGYNIDLVVLFMSAIPGMTIFVLSQYGQGPNSPWDKSGWHDMWMFYVFEVLLGALFILSLHYPRVSDIFRMNNFWVLAILTIAYDWCVQVTRASGMGGAAMQEWDSHRGKSKRNPAMATVNAFGFSLAMLSFAFMGNGYLTTYKQAEQDRDNWPTKHFTTKKAFWYWYSSSAKGAYRACMTSYTRDIRSTILGKKEHLFIVYEDTPPEDEDPFFDLPFIKKKEEAECTPYPFVPPY
ncbi:conserved hypothetical protein [Theileria equi strain WA]|uniref:Uncharacterized protein n=1 Tax=Theileria equi strain WA TaxID=1537102 RepID=L1LFM2_THEEQ|nr:conserved hypothetical protein [Theileria equi strain WA]EKX73953.1 conserved hypothetical protein [Theileria equi strain WA]|eukprot:XP_004833405.1 conserved hypothetical protein [Theileria equi strain WA]